MARMSEFTFLSSDGQTALSAREYLPEGDPVGIVQIVHGIAEHIARYDAFAAFLAEHGYIVVLHDQLGHGKARRTRRISAFSARKTAGKRRCRISARCMTRRRRSIPESRISFSVTAWARS